MRVDTIWFNARLATLAEGAAGLGVIEHGAVACRDGVIVYAGAADDLPRGLHELEGAAARPVGPTRSKRSAALSAWLRVSRQRAA